MMGSCTLSKFVDNKKLGGKVDTPDGCAVIQKDLNKLEKWDVQEREVLNPVPGEEYPGTSTGASSTSWKIALQKNVLGVLVNIRLDMSQKSKRS